MRRRKKVRGMVRAVLIGIIIVFGIGVIIYFGDSSKSSGGGYNRCNDVVDNYEPPDFSHVKSVLENEEMIHDLPSKGSLSFVFFHVVEGCTFGDKFYYITKGSVEEKRSGADIRIMVYSDYAGDFGDKSLCEIVQSARANGEFRQSSELSKVRLLIRYVGMLKYRECFGFEV